jgi:DNA-binding transcriptional regulator WhiA
LVRTRGAIKDKRGAARTYLRLAHTLGEFLERLRTQARGLDVLERQRVVRLLVKEGFLSSSGM